MSEIMLSSSVRQNLLSLQSTADLLSRTQNRLATGNKVNSALDSPTNFFTSLSLNNRASDITNLLDGIGNGIQVIEAANTGLTSLQKLVDTAKSVTNQALQATSGYSSKASVVSAAITSNGAAVTADDLRGAGTVASASVAGSAVNAAAGAPIPITAATTLASIGFTVGPIIGIGGYTMDFGQTTGNNIQPFGANFDLSVATVGDLLNAVQTYSSHSITYSISGTGQITLNGTNFALNNFAGTALSLLGLTATASTNSQIGSAVTLPGAPGGPITSGTLLTNLSTAITTSDTLTVNGKTVSFVNTGAGNTISATGATIDLASASVGNVLTAITTISGGSSSISAGAITLNTSTSDDLALAGSALTKLGLAAGTTKRTGLTLSLGAVGNGSPTTVTFGDGTGGTVKSLADLNATLGADNLLATLDAAGKLTITTTNDYASASFPTIGGTASSNASGAFAAANGSVLTASPVADANAQTTRAKLVSQYNAIITQIVTTTDDASFNGVNLLAGDQLKLVFSETGKSSLTIPGVTDDPAGLGLSSLAAGVDFLDNAQTQKVMDRLEAASTTLRTQASTLGSNLSIVQIRQDFSKSLINVLQTGASNLTLADTNGEAANSQALSTRQSIAVSALALANASQQGVLQLLR